jgi:hypothetical protein
MDIEGWEANVIRGAADLLARHVDHVLLEYSPGVHERINRTFLQPQVRRARRAGVGRPRGTRHARAGQPAQRRAGAAASRPSP